MDEQTFKINEIHELVDDLNYYRDSYYNKNFSVVTDQKYDKLFDKLVTLEKETGIVMSNSPTVTVGYEVKSALLKTKHSHPMLSLDKTKAVEDLIHFANTQDCLLSLKMDGLTVLLTYENCELVKAETRGNGEIGEDITHNAKVFKNIPLHINNPNHVEIEGEAIITYNDFNTINEALPEDERYKTPRNLVSGSVRQLDSLVASGRHIRFIVWKMPFGFTRYSEGLEYAKKLGFDVVPYNFYDVNNIERIIELLKGVAEKFSYPIDGLVMTYENVEYGKSLGMTGHHPKHSIAFKFYDELVESKMIDVDWTMGKTGSLTPTAIFDPVEIDGTEVSRASLHNVSIFEDLNLASGDTVTVYKANQIIPQIQDNLDREIEGKVLFDIPKKCPICNHNTELRQDGVAKILYCSNPNCKGKLLGKCTHFVSKNAMNVNGLSESTLQKFIENGYITSFVDIYDLKDNFYEDISKLEGFGKRSVDKLMQSIEDSRNTTLDRFIYALCIPMVGRSASKAIAKYCNYDFDVFINRCNDAFNWSVLDDIGFAMELSLDGYTIDNYSEIIELSKYMTFEKPEEKTGTSLDGKTFVITGSLNVFTNRDEAKEKIESSGGKVASSVSKKTDYLVNNDINSTSGKNKKAKELGVPIISEEDLIKLLTN